MPSTPQPRTRRWWLVPAVLAVLLLAWALWLGVRAVQVRADLEQARAELTGVEPDLSALEELEPRVESAGDHAAAARRRTEDPLWRLAELLPFVGDDARAVRLVSTATHRLTRDVADPLLDSAAAVDPAAIRRPDGGFDLGPLQEAAPVLSSAATAAAAAERDLSAVDRSGLLAPVADAVDELAGRTQEVAGLTEQLARAARLVPAMLGADGERRYFLAFQNPAEARGTGGLVGTYGVLVAADGRLELATVGANDELAALPEPPVDLGQDYRALYGGLPRDVRNVNMSPHFPYAGRLLLAGWQQRTGEDLDGVIALDPVALGRLVEATGPLQTSTGETLDGEDLADVTLRDVYARFDDRQRARQAYLEDVVRQAFSRLTDPQLAPQELVEGLADVVEQRRLLVYSAHAEEQEELERTAVAGALPPASSGATRAVVVNNASGSKLDYYLERDVRYEVGCADGDRTPSTLRVTLRNTAPESGLPPYVYSHLPPGQGGTTPATHRVIVSAFVPEGTGVHGLTVAGSPAGFATGRERGYHVLTATVDLPPDEPVELVWTLDEPRVDLDVTFLEQPLVRPAHYDVVPSCPAG